MAANCDQHYWHAATPREWQNSDSPYELVTVCEGGCRIDKIGIGEGGDRRAWSPHPPRSCSKSIGRTVLGAEPATS